MTSLNEAGKHTSLLAASNARNAGPSMLLYQPAMPNIKKNPKGLRFWVRGFGPHVSEILLPVRKSDLSS